MMATTTSRACGASSLALTTRAAFAAVAGFAAVAAVAAFCAATVAAFCAGSAGGPVIGDAVCMKARMAAAMASAL